MQKNFRKIIEFMLLLIAIGLLTIDILKMAFPSFFGAPNYVLIEGAGLVYLIQRHYKRQRIREEKNDF